MYCYYNPNPVRRDTGDCVIRAIAKVTGTDWDTAFDAVCATAKALADMPDKNTTWGEHLRRLGFQQFLIGKGAYYTVEDFCRENPRGRYVLAIDGHVVCAIDGDWYDSFDSGGMVPIYVWYCSTCKN